MMLFEDPPVSDTPEPLANGRYTLSNTLGQGGMATVYGGFDTMLEVDRAVKVLSPALCQSEKLRKRFLAEARAMAKLRHTNIVTVFDVGVESETPYIVMEMIQGGSVIDLMERGGPQPPAIAGPIMLGTLAGLQASHDRGVVHRDIKPHNMLITLDGIVKITDFGIAHMQEDERSFTKTGAVMGTLAYMPPEQRQSAKGLGPTADIFAAGASLFALLTGQEPFDLYNEALHPKLFERVPEVLSKIVARACSYEPADRYQSASKMSLALYEALRALGVEIAPDYRVSLQSPSSGTVFFDPDAKKPVSSSLGVPAAAVESTTINPKETWFTTTGERIEDDAAFATTVPPDRKAQGLRWAGFAAMVVVAGFAVFSFVDQEQVPMDAGPAVKAVEAVPTQPETPAELQDAANELNTGRELAADAMKQAADAEARAQPKQAEPVRTASPRPTRAASKPAAAPTPLAPPPPAEVVEKVESPAVPAAAPAPPAPTGPTQAKIYSVPRSQLTIDAKGMGLVGFTPHQLSPGRHMLVLQTQAKDGDIRTKQHEFVLEEGEEWSWCWNFNTNSKC